MRLESDSTTIQLRGKVNSTTDISMAAVPSCKKSVSETYSFDDSRKTVKRTVVINGKTVETILNLEHSVVDLSENPQNIFDQTYLRSKTSPHSSGEFSSVYVADLFAGCGGLSLGIREACRATGKSFDSLLAIDKDSPTLEIYKNNFAPRKSSDSGIWDLVSGELGDDLQESEKELLESLPEPTILLAGPPCQGHSNLNNHTRRKDERNHLYERVGRFAEISKARFILIENVPTVIHDKNKSMQKTSDMLKHLGYHVDTGMVNFCDLGVPQKRKRHVLVAARDRKFSVAGIVEKYAVKTSRSVRWAIEDLEDVNEGDFNSVRNISENNKARIDYLHDENAHDLPNHLRPICHHGDHSYSAMYGRLHYDIPAPTITTGYASPGQGRYVHPSKKRTLTPHEAARLQFFPDFFSFSKATLKKTFSKSIGNAVPMKLSYIFGLEFMSEL